MLSIIAPHGKSKHPLLFRRVGEMALPAYLQLDLDSRVVTFGYWERDTEPKYVTLGHACWWRIDPKTTRTAAVKVAKDLRPLLECICAGYSVDWNGRDHVGVLDEHAAAARGEITAVLEAQDEYSRVPRREPYGPAYADR
jgi:hypothetical protein